jgi:hypothetical protein
LTIDHPPDFWKSLRETKERTSSVIVNLEDLRQVIANRTELVAQSILSSFDSIPSPSDFRRELESRLKSTWDEEGPLEGMGLKVDSFESSVEIVDPVSIAEKRSVEEVVISKMNSNVTGGVYEVVLVKAMGAALEEVIVLESLQINAMGVSGRVILAPGVSRPEGTPNELDIILSTPVTLMKALVTQEETSGA